jgi:hypothetical protein
LRAARCGWPNRSPKNEMREFTNTGAKKKEKKQTKESKKKK